MLFQHLLVAALALVAEAGIARKVGQKRNPQHVGKDASAHRKRSDAWLLPQDLTGQPVQRPEYKYHKRAGATIIAQNANTTKFAVNGTALPLVDFDIGESYAGLLPLSDAKNETREYYFWFFPSANPAASDEILIWLNGGPGCSSLEGLFQENGPFLWQQGTYAPYPNSYSWTNLTNVVWIEYPLGAGFNQGMPTCTNETCAAREMLGFWKSFIDTFGFHGRKIYIAGESYAGFYIPYIADAMYANGNKDYYNLQAIQINDPSTSYDAVHEQLFVKPFIDFHHNLFPFSDAYYKSISALDQSCGYAAFREKYFTFPPPAGGMPLPPGNMTGCNLYDSIEKAVTLINPCFNVYKVSTTCPTMFDPLGFSGPVPFVPDGFNTFFNRTDVQKAINAPIKRWQECVNGVLYDDTSLPSGLSVLPGVIEKNKRTIIAHGQLDYRLIPNGTLFMIQNMTWNGEQGFLNEPNSVFNVPTYHVDYNVESLAGAGRMGTTHTERGLTWVETWLSGHMIPEDAPGAAYRQLEFLLGRIPSLDYVGDFTTQSG